MSLHSLIYLIKFNLKSHIGGGIFDSLTLTCRGILAQKAQGLCKDLHDIHKIRGGVNEVFTTVVPHLNGRVPPYATVPEPGSRGIGILARLPPPMEHRLHVAAMPLPRRDFVIFYANFAGSQQRVANRRSVHSSPCKGRSVIPYGTPPCQGTNLPRQTVPAPPSLLCLRCRIPTQGSTEPSRHTAHCPAGRAGCRN